MREPIGHLRSKVSAGYAELTLLGRALIAIIRFFTQTGGKEFGAIGNGYRRVLLLAVTDETELHFRTWFAASYFRDQIIALGDFLALQSRNGIANLQSGLVCGTSHYHAGNRDAGTRSVDASNLRILLPLQHNPD